MKHGRTISRYKKTWFCILTLGVILFVVDRVYISYLASHWKQYANYGNAYESLDDIDWENPHNKTDPYLVWTIRSKEYQGSNEDQKYNMRMSWAGEYRDRHVGGFARIAVVGCLIVFGLIGVFWPED